MKNLKLVLAAFLFMAFTAVQAQVEQVNLTQKKGVFTTESLTLASGEYQFNIHNENVGTDVGFVIVPKGMYDADKHIKEAYVTKPVADGMTVASNVVKLAPGEYEYFCPLNKTPKYSLTVTDGMMKDKMDKSGMKDKMHKSDMKKDGMGKSDKKM